ncbi:MAG: diguanylate cyclase [Lachnospiraceae bacterium]|nr:diguanylate cyclase [Lachnospiraceae bacterium]
MFENGRKTIGVILCDVPAHYQEQVCQAISSYALNKGYNIAYFTFFTSYGVDTRNGRGETNIIHLVPYEKLDAIVLCHDTITNPGALAKVWEYIDTRCSCPVVTLRRDSGKYPCVLVNQEHLIENVVYHFTDVHNKKRLAFMSGPLDHPDSIARLEDYKRGLANRGIPFDEKLVFEGDFWNEKAKAAAEYFTMELEEMPDAVICANDYMATSLMNELIDKGFLIPDDIAISGFDDIWETSVAMPPITTVAVPVEEMTQGALQLIEKIWDGEKVERVNFLDAKVEIRNSCGCETFNMQAMLAKRVRQVKDHEEILELIQTNTYMFVDLSDLNSLDGIEHHIRLLGNSNNHVRNFFICLGEGKGTNYPKYRSANPGFAKKSKAVGAVMNRQSIQTEVFTTSNLLPAEASEDRPMIYYFFPLHNNQYSYGYFAISYEGVYAINKTFQNWLAILGNALESIRLKQKNQGLLHELSNLYVHDALTGLYNRRGFDSISEEYYVKAKKEKKGFCIIAIDMDNLKIVNDRFGHMNGDLALKTIGAAMEYAAEKGDACARVGGDEYNVVGIGYTTEKAEDFVREFHGYLEDFNENSELPYLVSASVGYYLMEPGESRQVEECINLADAQLYEHKKKKKEEKRDNVIRLENDG